MPSARHPGYGSIVGLAVIAFAVLAGYLVWSGKVAGGKPICQVCHRELHDAAAFTIALENGGRQRTCCPRCGLRVVILEGGRAIDAVDFRTARKIPAADAIYLEGSDIMECCSATGFRTEEGTYSDIHFDRCMPSLLAFARREDAEAVKKDHGGRIIGFEEARQSVAGQIGR
jgi:hypothetical protein